MKKLLILACCLAFVAFLPGFSTGTAHAKNTGSKQHTSTSLAVHPLATCSGDGCTGQFVGNTNCGSSAQVLLDIPIYKTGTHSPIGSLRFWYSYTCQTNWTQAWATVPCSSVFDIYTTVTRNIGSDDAQQKIETDSGIYGGCSDSSPMVYAPNETAWGYARIWLKNSHSGLQQTGYY